MGLGRPAPSLSVTLPFACALAFACDPYERFTAGEFSAGPVDPVNFPPANLGVGGNRLQSGRGSFTEIAASVNGATVGYYAYPFPPSQLAGDPRRLLEDGRPYSGASTPPAYAFDPTDTSPFPPAPLCVPPEGYTYDPQRDDVHHDEQGNVFAALPTATYTIGALPVTRYVPIVTQIPVRTNGLPCQGIKSEATLLEHPLVTLGIPEGRYLAWLIIDPGAAVYRVGQTAETSTGVGTQRWGWYNHYLLAYLEGGHVPTQVETISEGVPPQSKVVVRMVTQRLYYPRSQIILGSTTVPGAIGLGADVLERQRGDPAYSPVCEVMTYDAGTPLPLDQLPRDAATILSLYNPAENPIRPANPPYLYCLQLS